MSTPLLSAEEMAGLTSRMLAAFNTAGVAALVQASTAALRFYDNLDRLHDEGEPEVLDALQRAVDEVRALSPAPAQGCAPTVKKLEWIAVGKRCWRARTVLGYYRVAEYVGLSLPAGWETPDQFRHDAESVDAAKAAAQADYEARILSALEPAPLRVEGENG